MPFIQPSRSDVHINAPLTNISVAHFQSLSNFVADQVFPNIPVAKQSDVFFTLPRGQFNRNEVKLRPPGTEANQITHRISSDTYTCPVYALKHSIADQVRANTDSPLNLDMQVTRMLTYNAAIHREKTWVDAFFKAGVWGTDITGVASAPGAGQVLQWNNANSTPIEDVRAGKAAMLEKTGYEPNVMVVGYKVYQYLVDHPDVLDRIKYGQTSGAPAMASLNTLAQLFEMERIVVMKAIENTAQEGATDAHSFIGGKHALLVYAAPAPGLYIPSGGYTFSWNGYMGAAGNGVRIKRFRDELIESDSIEIQMAFTQKLISADLGYMFATIVA